MNKGNEIVFYLSTKVQLTEMQPQFVNTPIPSCSFSDTPSPLFKPFDIPSYSFTSRFFNIPPIFPSALDFEEAEHINELWTILDHVQLMIARLNMTPGLALQQITGVVSKCVEIFAMTMFAEIFSRDCKRMLK